MGLRKSQFLYPQKNLPFSTSSDDVWDKSSVIPMVAMIAPLMSCSPSGPMGKMLLLTSRSFVRKVARNGESGVQHSYNIKMGKYSERCEAKGIVIIPLIVDTFVRWHKDSLEVVSKLGRQVSRQTGKEEEEIVRQLRQRVAILLVRDNVNMFDSRTPSFPQAVIDADVDNNY